MSDAGTQVKVPTPVAAGRSVIVTGGYRQRDPQRLILVRTQGHLVAIAGT